MKKRERLEYINNEIAKREKELERITADGNTYLAQYVELDLRAYRLLKMKVEEE